MCLKTDTILLKYTFHQFQYFDDNIPIILWKSISKYFSQVVLTEMA